MKPSLPALPRVSLSDELTERLAAAIRSGQYQPGDRLPAIMEMARQFGVGHPTVREALKRLEVVGVVEIRHGSGVYVRQQPAVLLMPNPVYGGAVTKELLLEVVEARLSVEVQAAGLAAQRATPAHLAQLDVCLAAADGAALHREIAQASGNAVLAQVQAALAGLFADEQQQIFAYHHTAERHHAEHAALVAAIRAGDAALAQARMLAHLEGIRALLRQWNLDQRPVA